MIKMLTRIAISLSFLGLLIYIMRDKIPDIVVKLQEVDRFYFALAAAIFFSTVFILAARLRMIFMAEGVSIPLKHTVQLTFVGYFFNNFLPTSVGGDIVKAMSAARVTGQTVKSVTCVLMDRIFGLFTFIMIPCVSAFFLGGESFSGAVSWVIYGFFAMSLFCFAMLFNRQLARRFGFIESILKRFKLDKQVRSVYDGLHEFKNRKWVVVKAMLWSVVGQGIGVLVTYLLAVALFKDPAQILTVDIVLRFFVLVPVVQLLSMLPSVNGLGIREFGYVHFLKPYIGAEHAAALSILWLGILFVLSLMGGVIYLLRPEYHVHYKAKKTA